MVRSLVVLTAASPVFRTDYHSKMLSCTLSSTVSTVFQALLNSEFTLYIFSAV
jgi:hypothetical protein